jgi:tRNA(Ile)-lysidine synthase
MRSCALCARVRRASRHYQLFGSGDRLIVAVSGGADSTALAHALPDIAAARGAEVIGLAHLNHRLRDAAADDEAFCEAMAGRLGLPFFVDRVDVAAEARLARTSIEDAGRTVRYAFLEATATRAGATRIAVAHTLNDQAETVLLRLLRGAGPVGLAGIYPRAGNVVRPLLQVTREQVETYLKERGLVWVEDASNRDVTIPRNRIRHQLMPWLREHFGASIDAVMARQADLFREDAEWLDAEATEIARHLVLESNGRTDVPLTPLLSRPPALVRRVVLSALRTRANGRFIGLQHVEAVLDAAHGVDTRAASDLPGQRLERRGDLLSLQTVEADPLRQGKRRGRAAPRKPMAGESVSGESVSKEPGVQRSPGVQEAQRRQRRGVVK